MKVISRAFLLFLICWLVLLLIPEEHNVKYKKSNLYQYYTLTDREIRNAPVISTDYYFTYITPDEGQWIRSSVVFKGGDISLLRRYLEALGFFLYRVQNNGQEEIWISRTGKYVEFSLWNDRKNNTISLTKVII